MDQNQKLRIALVIIFSSRIRHFNLEARISQQMMSYKQISVFTVLYKPTKNQHLLRTTILEFWAEFFLPTLIILRHCNINPIFDTEFSLGAWISYQKRAPIGSQASFQNIVSHCSKTALFLVKCSFTAVRVKILTWDSSPFSTKIEICL